MTRPQSVRSSMALASALLSALLLGGCIGPGAGTSSNPPAGQSGVRGVATAGPVCPVEKNPPDPSCAARPVAGATIVIRDPSGKQAAAAVTGADGSFSAELSAGDYVIEAQPVQGLMGTAPSQNVTVRGGAFTDVKLDYDTGIR